jgi:type 1 glutamine amidotransferase
MMLKQICAKAAVLTVLAASIVVAQAADKKIVFIAGVASHGPGDHEHRAGCLLLAKCLSQFPGITSEVHSNGWPTSDSVFKDAAAVIIYADGGEAHPAIKPERLKLLGELVDKGVGMGCLHYGVEVPKHKGGPEFLQWIGGYFETYWSVNPTWEAEFKSFPKNAVTSGVQPFKIRDEWYYHMRFPEGMKNVTPILTAVPPDSTRGRPGANEPHGGNPEVQKHMGEPEHMMWTIERPDGGRGFGFTGAHYHKNWGEENFRKVVLNAILWVAKADVPQGGVTSEVSAEDLKQNLDRKGK